MPLWYNEDTELAKTESGDGMGNIKPWEELTIRDDYMFKLVMRRKHICKTMIEKLLKLKLSDIRYIDEEKTVKPKCESKGVRLDVYVEGSGEIFEIEMQVRQPDSGELAKRVRYYQAMLDTDHLMAGQKYKTLPTTYIIFICPFDPFGKSRHIYTFRNLCVEENGLELDDKTTKVFVNSKGTANDVTPDVKAFLDYVNGVFSNDTFVQEIEDEIVRVKEMQEERVKYMTYEMKIEEERELAEEKGVEKGENKLARLISCLLSSGNADDVEIAVKDINRRQQLYTHYGIS